MNDVITEMTDEQARAMARNSDLDLDEDEPSPAMARLEARTDAEYALLRHLALEGELSLRRDQLQAEHAAVSQRLAQARQQRQGLVEAVQAAGGKLPSWEP